MFQVNSTINEINLNFSDLSEESLKHLFEIYSSKKCIKTIKVAKT